MKSLYDDVATEWEVLCMEYMKAAADPDPNRIPIWYNGRPTTERLRDLWQEHTDAVRTLTERHGWTPEELYEEIEARYAQFLQREVNNGPAV